MSLLARLSVPNPTLIPASRSFLDRMVRMAEEMMTPWAECDTCTIGFNHGYFLVSDIITMDKKWTIIENACFIQILNGGKPRRLPVIGHGPYLPQKRRKASRSFCQKFNFISCLCNMGTNWCACFDGELSYCLI